MIIGLVSCIIASCGKTIGDDDPKDKSSNTNQITGMVISKPLSYDDELGYKLAVDENGNGFFDKEERYVWMPNDIYTEIQGKDSIIIKAVRFHETHLFKDCCAYIIFDWHRGVSKKDTIQTIKK